MCGRKFRSAGSRPRKAKTTRRSRELPTRKDQFLRPGLPASPIEEPMDIPSIAGPPATHGRASLPQLRRTDNSNRLSATAHRTEPAGQDRFLRDQASDRFQLEIERLAVALSIAPSASAF